jgi:hypothetical protein
MSTEILVDLSGDAPLTSADQRALAQHEAVITDGIGAFIAVGEALAAIRDERLYRATHRSFDAYLAARWPQIGGRSHASRLITAAEVQRDLLPIGNSLTNESQARALAPLPPEDRRAVMQRATEAAGGKSPTAAQIRDAARPDPLAAVAEALRRGDTKAAYVAARESGAHYSRAMAAVDARVEGRPLAEALALLSAPEPAPPAEAPAETITVSTKSGPRESPVLRRLGVLALTPAWLGGGLTARLSDRQFSITHVPTGYMLLRLFDDQAEAVRALERAAELDWPPLGTGEALPIALAEQLARIFGVAYPPAEAFDKAFARAKALGRYLGRGVKNDDGTSAKIFVLALDPPSGAGSPEHYERWVGVLARLDALEEPAPPEEIRALIDRAAAVGCALAWRPDGSYRMVEPDGAAGEHPYYLAALARVRHFETATPLPASPEDEEPDAEPADQRERYVAAERALVAERAAARPSLLWLARVGIGMATRGTPLDDDELFELIVEGLLMADDETLAAAPVAAPVAAHQVANLRRAVVSAELAAAHGDPPGAGAVAALQRRLDAQAGELADDQYERLAQRIGELRRAAAAGVTP